MSRHLYYLNRELDEGVLKSLVCLITRYDLNNVQVTNSVEFKDLCHTCFKVKRENRPSVSQLSDIFKKYDCLKPGSLAVEYAKTLEAWAFQNNLRGFQV